MQHRKCQKNGNILVSPADCDALSVPRIQSLPRRVLSFAAFQARPVRVVGLFHIDCVEHPGRAPIDRAALSFDTRSVNDPVDNTKPLLRMREARLHTLFVRDVADADI